MTVPRDRKIGRVWLSVTPGLRPVVFVHELGTSPGEREHRLAAARNAWGAWVYAQRGHAPSGWAAGRFYRVSDFAVDLVRLLREEVGVPSVLVGEGSGGLVAVLAAAAAPESVTHVHLLPGTGRGWGATSPMLTGSATVNRSWLGALLARPAPDPVTQDGDDPVLACGPAELVHEPAVRAAAAGLRVPWSAQGPHFLADQLPAATRLPGCLSLALPPDAENVGGPGQTTVMGVEFQVTFDSADPAAQAAFWAGALHYVLQPPPSGFPSWDAALDAWGVPAERRNDRSAIVDPAGVGPRVFFQRVPEPKTAKNRVHLDLRAAAGLTGEARLAALEAECARLVALGASRVERFEPGALSAGFIVIRDPEGNEFCLD